MRGGGGSRGGRSRSSRSSSRRYYRSRRYGYGRGYYGHGGGSSIFGLILFLGFGYLVISVFVGAALTAPYQIPIYLEPGRQVMVEMPSSYKSAEINLPTTAEVYLFENAPTITGSVTTVHNGTAEINGDAYYAWILRVYEGTSVELTWNASGAVDVYLLEGKSEFDDWVEGTNVVGSFKGSGQVGKVKYEGTRVLDVFFAFENRFSSPLTVEALFKVVEPAYDTISGQKISTMTTIDLEKTKFLVIKNPTNTDIEGQVNMTRNLSFGIFFLGWLVVTAGLISGVVYLVRKITKPKTGTPVIPTGASSIPPQGYVGQPIQGSYTYTGTQNFARPSPKYCPNCSQPVLQSDKFCMSCGSKL